MVSKMLSGSFGAGQAGPGGAGETDSRCRFLFGAGQAGPGGTGETDSRCRLLFGMLVWKVKAHTTMLGTTLANL